MTTTIAIIGKSGSGKTTLTKSILTNLHKIYPGKSILLVDNDLSCELGYTFGVDIEDTIYDIRSGQYKHKTPIPAGMPKHEYIEWALQDMMVNLYDDVDLLVSGPVSTMECTCYISNLIRDALVRLVRSYDIVMFDCEYDLEYLNKLVEYPIDVTLIVTDTSITSIFSSANIKHESARIALPGQIGLILNKVKNRQIPENIAQMIDEFDLDILGTLPYDEKLEHDSISKKSDIITEATRELLFRLNLPPI